MRKRLRMVLRRRPKLMETAGQVAGAGMVTYGLWQVWEPLAWMAGGLALALLSLGLGGDR